MTDSTLRHHRDKEYAAVIATTTAATMAQLDIDAKCEYTRDDCIDCATRHADIDKDGRINQTEVDVLKARMLSWWQRDLAWFARYTTEYIMYRCADADGFITARSFQEKRGMCLEHCADWMRFMPMCMPLDRHKHAYAHNRPGHGLEPVK
jgi:hypothetical protein